MPKFLNPDRLKIDYDVLGATRKFDIKKFQPKAGSGESSKWRHVAVSLGGCDSAKFKKQRVVFVSGLGKA